MKSVRCFAIPAAFNRHLDTTTSAGPGTPVSCDFAATAAVRLQTSVKNYISSSRKKYFCTDLSKWVRIFG
jgi:hypothetical protein